MTKRTLCLPPTSLQKLSFPNLEKLLVNKAYLYKLILGTRYTTIVLRCVDATEKGNGHILLTIKSISQNAHSVKELAELLPPFREFWELQTCEQVVNLWNSLPYEEMVSGLDAFERGLDTFLEEKSITS